MINHNNNFFFGKMIFIVCEQKNRQKNTNKCYIQYNEQ